MFNQHLLNSTSFNSSLGLSNLFKLFGKILSATRNYFFRSAISQLSSSSFELLSQILNPFTVKHNLVTQFELTPPFLTSYTRTITGEGLLYKVVVTSNGSYTFNLYLDNSEIVSINNNGMYSKILSNKLYVNTGNVVKLELLACSGTFLVVNLLANNLSTSQPLEVTSIKFVGKNSNNELYSMPVVLDSGQVFRADTKLSIQFSKPVAVNSPLKLTLISHTGEVSVFNYTLDEYSLEPYEDLFQKAVVSLNLNNLKEGKYTLIIEQVKTALGDLLTPYFYTFELVDSKPYFLPMYTNEETVSITLYYSAPYINVIVDEKESGWVLHTPTYQLSLSEGLHTVKVRFSYDTINYLEFESQIERITPSKIQLYPTVDYRAGLVWFYIPQSKLDYRSDYIYIYKTDAYSKEYTLTGRVEIPPVMVEPPTITVNESSNLITITGGKFVKQDKEYIINSLTINLNEYKLLAQVSTQGVATIYDLYSSMLVLGVSVDFNNLNYYLSKAFRFLNMVDTRDILEKLEGCILYIVCSYNPEDTTPENYPIDLYPSLTYVPKFKGSKILSFKHFKLSIPFEPLSDVDLGIKLEFVNVAQLEVVLQWFATPISILPLTQSYMYVSNIPDFKPGMIILDTEPEPDIQYGEKQ